MNKIIIGAIMSLVILSAPALAWNFHINADVSDASIIVGGAGTNVQEGYTGGFKYSVSTLGGIDGSGTINTGGKGGENGGGAGIEISGSGAEGDVFAQHDLEVSGCCAGQCPCPTGYQYAGESKVTILGGDNVELELKGGAGIDGAGQSLEVGSKRNPIVAGAIDAGMTSTLTVNGESQTHTMGAYGENVWFFAKGKQKLDAENCGVNGFFISVMGYRESACVGETCPE